MIRRDVRTLLFCKVSPTSSNATFAAKNHSEIYRDICNTNSTTFGISNDTESYPEQQDRRTFFAFGGFDALITYEPKLTSGSSWLHDIYKDKQHIVRSNSPNVVYHQMHLISNHNGNRAFWEASDDEYPFFLTTLVYGVKHSDDKTIADNECSKYEHVIRTHINKERQKAKNSFRFAVYNGISISDVVILWRASDIGEIMEIISRVEYTGTARKTITTLCFPLDSDGKIKSSVIKHLEEKKADKFLSSEKQSTNSDRDTEARDANILNLSIHGSIRNRKLFGELYREMTEGKRGSYLPKDAPSYQVLTCDTRQTLSLGKNDFIISAQVDGPIIAKLAQFYYSRHDQLSQACWEILTDFRKTDSFIDISEIKPAHPPADILSSVYKDYLENCSSLSNYSWCNIMLELLGTHYYIDHHPVMHGPSYLIYDGLKIANAYFFRRVPDFTDEKVLASMLEQSDERILNYIHNLDQLTEQITRNDDAMLNNRSNSHSIHFSLPESAIDFYHAFLRRIVDYVVEYDHCQGKKPDDFEYDFLLSPKVRKQFRFSEMFDTNLQYRAVNEQDMQMIWPRKQAYILELPIESVFTPLAVFIPVVHECFHCFGDSLRMRLTRRRAMAGFLATVIMTAAGCGDDTYYIEATRQLSMMLYYGPEYKKGAPTPKIPNDIYLETVIQNLTRNAYFALGHDGLDRLYELTDCKYPTLYSDSVISFWLAAQDNFYDSAAKGRHNANPNSPKVTIMEKVIGQCKTYFKECYADVMTIALLKLTPEEYLNQIAYETSRHYTEQNALDPALNSRADNNVAVLVQRYALVMNACLNRVSTFTEQTCNDALNQLKSGSYRKMAELLDSCYTSIKLNSPMPSGDSYLPVSALKYVLNYLCKTIDKLTKNPPTMLVSYKDGTETYSLKKLAEDFDIVIRQGNMFGQRFYELIYQHHDQIREKVKRNTQ